MGSERAFSLPVAVLLAGLVVCLIASAFLGHLWTRSSTVVLTLPDQQTALEIAGVEYRAESLKSPPYYGYRVTWVPDAHRWIGIEVEVIHAKVLAEDRAVRMRGTRRGAGIDASLPLSSVVQRLAMSHGLNFIFANVALRRELGPADAQGVPRFVAVVRAGAGPTVPHTESTVEHVNRDQYQTGGLGTQVAGGFEAAVWPRLAVLGEYKFTWASPRLDVAGGQAIVPARSHHVIGGLAYRF
jgi:hypothetical protein